MDYLCESVNAMFKSSMFPNFLKLADVAFLHKKDSKELKGNNAYILTTCQIENKE